MSSRELRQQLEAGIDALRAQRALLGDAAVEASIAALRGRLAALLDEPAAPPEGPVAEPAQTLRQVTILFLDVVGSTTLSQHLDPEGIGAVMDDALVRATAVVEAHGGRVLQYAGDNLLAAFGADAAREDDAERAVRAGLALLALGRRLGAEVKTRHAHDGFNVRVGVHTGGVLLGGGVDAEGSIRGIAVNIAARMEQTAPAGGLRISHDTYALVRGIFDVQVQEPLVVKGVDQPIQTCLVLRARPRSFRTGTRGIEGLVTRMVGRDAELDTLKTAFENLLRERRLATVTVVGEAGLGKSRLLDEFAAWAELRPEPFHLLRGRATPATLTQPFGLLRDLLAWRFQIADDDPLQVARQKLEDAVVPLFLQDEGADGAQSHAHLLGHLIGIEWGDSRHLRGILDDARQIRNRACHAAAQLVRRIGAADGHPVVMQLEDLHWADDESLEFLAELAKVNRDLPLLLLAFTRPTLYERRPIASGPFEGPVRVTLQPLDRQASRELASELLQQLPEVPSALQDLLTGSAEGVPFYMEELLKMLIDRGVVTTGQVWTVDARRLLQTQVPPTLTGVLQARLDGLPASEKHALQQASIVGAVFWDQALSAVDEQAQTQLPALARRELALPRPDGVLQGLREYAFRHQLLHQVTYSTVLTRHKRPGHARVARWLAGLEEQGSLRAGDLLGLAAEHFERAGDALQAAEFHARAAERAAQRLSHDRVLAHVQRALELIAAPPSRGVPEPEAPALAELRWRLLLAREKTLGLQGRRDAQALDLDALAHLAEQRNDDRWRAEAACRRAHMAARMADWAALQAAAQAGIGHARRAGADRLRLQATRLLAVAQVYLGEPEAGRHTAREGCAEARDLGFQDLECLFINALSLAANVQGDFGAVPELVRQSLQSARNIGCRVTEAIALANLGATWKGMGELDKARQALDTAVQMLRVNGDRTIECSALTALSGVALWQADARRAAALATAALDIAEATQGRLHELEALLALGDAQVALNELSAATQTFSRARELALVVDPQIAHNAHAGLARAYALCGAAAAARQALQPVLDTAAGIGTLEGSFEPQRIELICAQVLEQLGDPAADAWLDRAHAGLLLQADAIADPALRAGFLRNIPSHRDITARWERRSPPRSPG